MRQKCIVRTPVPRRISSFNVETSRASYRFKNPSLQFQQRSFFNVWKVGHFRLTGSLSGCKPLFRTLANAEVAHRACILKSAFLVGEIVGAENFILNNFSITYTYDQKISARFKCSRISRKVSR